MPKSEYYRVCPKCGWRSYAPIQLDIRDFKAFCPTCYVKSVTPDKEGKLEKKRQEAYEKRIINERKKKHAIYVMLHLSTSRSS